MSQHQCTIRKVTPQDTPEVLPFITAARHSLFPGLKFKTTILPEDVSSWIASGHFLAAYTTKSPDHLIATIGFVPYDYRFPRLEFHGRKTVEVVRLFVLPEYRRSGLGNLLFRQSRGTAEGLGVEVMYLHTHPFLPGAVEFWENVGFGVVGVEEDEGRRTVHMKLELKGEGS
ncbi:hypothetical protein CLAFUW4_10401 [Fulvia fulva]|uniref:N-acetyltransferase domain-containing protein n=1 Tax=Passalora fulva TaxID=5499 RepID=A0A9Q8P7W7_PASFU|nr:uncharacterized protein CLAFUR5_05016 [Fulvia fulva]KAK4615548.1 hypothetical protein CLAFUR4_10405 [Fulvia fulva]KAK4616812.1 hypothetical protein CLAFUR0_10406 [Fulvia fulva]UJO16468.1 hypothetical protein CLAFUR5_05016 [Fulvia fulva]WPV18944.1 hypothetical protein CLAFUW4_10401 [Fulvia fulva]WPV34216.1 hypothetical protein CLAFUW7_10401 [Fulvia fulva]